MKIDAEVYFWKYEKSFRHPLIRENKMLQQHYLPEQIMQSLQRNGIDGCLAVVAEAAEVETRFLSELALTHPVIRGVTGWLNLYEPEALEKIAAFHAYEPLRAFRIDFQQSNMPDPAVMLLLKEYQYALEISLEGPADIDALKKWIKSNPDQHFILRDCGNPDTKQLPASSWETVIRELSKHRNLSCKISGLLERGNRKSWKPADLYPFLEILFDSFGPERLLYASDWPMLLLAGMYVQWKSLLEKFTERYSREDREHFFGENARRIYRL